MHANLNKQKNIAKLVSTEDHDWKEKKKEGVTFETKVSFSEIIRRKNKLERNK